MSKSIPEFNSDAELGKWIWKNLVPKSGQAKTIQGELLRANEKLRYEAQENGNANWDKGFEILLTFLEFTLCKKLGFFKDQNKDLRSDIYRLRKHKNPYLDDDLYDRIENEIFNFCRENPILIERKINTNLHR